MHDSSTIKGTGIHQGGEGPNAILARIGPSVRERGAQVNMVNWKQ